MDILTGPVPRSRRSSRWTRRSLSARSPRRRPTRSRSCCCRGSSTGCWSGGTRAPTRSTGGWSAESPAGPTKTTTSTQLGSSRVYHGTTWATAHATASASAFSGSPTLSPHPHRSGPDHVVHASSDAARNAAATHRAPPSRISSLQGDAAPSASSQLATDPRRSGLNRAEDHHTGWPGPWCSIGSRRKGALHERRP